MPYSKRGYKRRRVRSGRGYRSAGPLRIGAERKYYDADHNGNLTAANFSQNSWANCEFNNANGTMFCPTEGSAQENRLGRKVAVVGMTVRIHVSQPAASSTAYDDCSRAMIRCCLVQDKMASGVAFSAEDVITTPAASNIDAQQGYQNKDYFGRFKVLKDKNWVMAKNGMNVLAGGPAYTCLESEKHMRWHIKFRKPVIVRFNSSTGGVGDVVDNGWGLIFHYTVSGTTPSVPHVHAIWRITFYDLIG